MRFHVSKRRCGDCDREVDIAISGNRVVYADHQADSGKCPGSGKPVK